MSSANDWKSEPEMAINCQQIEIFHNSDSKKIEFVGFGNHVNDTLFSAYKRYRGSRIFK